MHVNFLMVKCGIIPPDRHGGIEWVVFLYVLGLRARGHTVSLIYENFTIDERFEKVHHNFKKFEGILIIQNADQKKWLEAMGVALPPKSIHLLHWRSPSLCNYTISPSRYCAILPWLQRTNVGIIPHPVYNKGIFTERSDLGEKAELLDRFFLHADAEYLFVAARLCAFKNALRCVKVANMLNLKLVWAGPLENKHLLKVLEENGHTYLGDIPRVDVLKLMKYSVAVLCLTKYIPVAEAYGLFQIEAHLCGAKVITSKSGGLYDTAFAPNSFTLPNFMPLLFYKNNLQKFIKKERRKVSNEYIRSFSTERAVHKLEDYLKRVNLEC